MRILLINLLLFIAFVAKAQISVPNHYFEAKDTATKTGLANWGSHTQFLVEPDSSTRKQGKFSLKLQSVEGKNFGAFNQVINLPKTAGYHKLTFSGFLKRDAVEGFCGFWINVFAGDQSIAFENMSSQKLDGTHDWTQVSASVVIDETATDLNIGGLLVGKGTAWFDELNISLSRMQPGTLPDSLQTYLNEVFEILEKKALYRDSVDWPTVRKKANFIAGEAKTYADCYPAINMALDKLGDHHSFLMPASASKEWQNASNEPNRVPPATGKMLENGIAYIDMPPVSSGDDKANSEFANSLHELIKSLDEQSPKGWILDLRNNTGGNCWPMLAGIGPLLGEGICGYFIQPGIENVSWFYKKGAAGMGKEKNTKVTKRAYKIKGKLPHVAVLTGPSTGSSGEVVTVAFRGRPNCKSFGQATAGLSTGNENFPLRDGAQIFLTSSIYADRNKTVFGSKINPDIAIPEEELEQTVAKASKWLLEQR